MTEKLICDLRASLTVFICRTVGCRLAMGKNTGEGKKEEGFF
jgi:hypothetical protein